MMLFLWFSGGFIQKLHFQIEVWMDKMFLLAHTKHVLHHWSFP